MKSLKNIAGHAIRVVSLRIVN